jgi:hypothetical protein
MKKKIPCSPPPNLIGKNARHLECTLGPSHWLCMKFLFPEEFLAIFGFPEEFLAIFGVG